MIHVGATQSVRDFVEDRVSDFRLAVHSDERPRHGDEFLAMPATPEALLGAVELERPNAVEVPKMLLHQRLRELPCLSHVHVVTVMARGSLVKNFGK